MTLSLAGNRRPEATVLPGWVKPQLTKLVDEPPDGGPEWHEIKFDGYRMHARLDRGARAISATCVPEMPPITRVRYGPES